MTDMSRIEERIAEIEEKAANAPKSGEEIGQVAPPTPISPEEMAAYRQAVAGPQQAMRVRRTIKVVELWRYDDFTTRTKRAFAVGTGDPEIVFIDAAPGQINLTYDNDDITSIFYNPEFYELRVLHEPFEEPAVPNIVIPQIQVDGNIIG